MEPKPSHMARSVPEAHQASCTEVQDFEFWEAMIHTDDLACRRLLRHNFALLLLGCDVRLHIVTRLSQCQVSPPPAIT